MVTAHPTRVPPTPALAPSCRSHPGHRTSDDLAGVFHLITVGTWLVVAGGRVTHLASPYVLRVTVFWALGGVFALILVVGIYRSLRRPGRPQPDLALAQENPLA